MIDYPSAVITDNLAANRRFFSEFLSDGQLKPVVANPVTGEPLHLLFDSTHNIKNIYNNFQKTRVYKFPPLPGSMANTAQFW
ncbi:MAG: hypothetical protein GY820_02380 [Gammaproteobacteria bacterium]|nr:hypothetical protein [Gammaproteobacteria bacterium]